MTVAFSGACHHGMPFAGSPRKLFYQVRSSDPDTAKVGMMFGQYTCQAIDVPESGGAVRKPESVFRPRRNDKSTINSSVYVPPPFLSTLACLVVANSDRLQVGYARLRE